MQKELDGLAKDSIRGGISLLIGEAIFTIVAGLSTIFIARFLGPSDFALYSLILVLPSLFGSLSFFGIDNALLHFVPKWLSEKKESKALNLFIVALFSRLIIAGLLSIVL